jgi:3-hydroxyacyl-CoA dehydrogenase/enoyl-CoA hydratase/3-hydroxybutyryl-CoA epimerase
MDLQGDAPLPAVSSAPGSLTFVDGVAWLLLDEPGKKVNTLSSRLFAWFGERLDEVAAAKPKGLVLISGKGDSFVAGADLEELQSLSDPAEVVVMLERGHRLLGRLEALPFPTVAAIHGACLGGGLELALACGRRVATEHAKTRLGFPEVQLGLIPGLGGTQRTPRLIGVPDALDLVLTGRQIDARKAKRLGLIDEACHPADLRAAALALLQARGRRKAAKKPLASRAGDFLSRTPLGGPLVWEKARAGVLKKTQGHYPAPLTAIEVMREGVKLPLGRALGLETGAFSQLVTSETAKSLISIFFAKNGVDGREIGRAHV